MKKNKFDNQSCWGYQVAPFYMAITPFSGSTNFIALRNKTSFAVNKLYYIKSTPYS